MSVSDATDRAVNAARYFVEAGQPQRALDTLNEATQLDVTDVRLFYLRSQALYDLDRYQDASEAAEAGLRIDPNNVALLLAHGNALSHLQRPADAERSILAALRIEPTDPLLLTRYAILVASAGQLDKADQLLAAAAQEDPNHPAVLHGRTVLAHVRGDAKGVARESQAILARDPNSAFGHYMLGAALEQRGRFGAATSSILEAARNDPTDPQVLAAAKRARLERHWLMWPTWIFRPLGPIGTWIAVLVLLLVLNRMGLRTLAGALAILYFLLCIYSWVAAYIISRKLRE